MEQGTQKIGKKDIGPNLLGSRDKVFGLAAAHTTFLLITLIIFHLPVFHEVLLEC